MNIIAILPYYGNINGDIIAEIKESLENKILGNKMKSLL